MKRTAIVMVSVAAIFTPIALLAQVPNEGLANAIAAARQKNAALMRQYNWNCRTELLQNNKMVDLRIDLVSLGTDGRLQHTLLNDQTAQLPRGFLRHAIAQGQERKAEQAVHGLHSLVERYTLPTAGKVVAFMVQAHVKPITSPGAPTQLQVQGKDVVVPGDTFTMMFNGATMQPTSIKISTTINGNAADISGTFTTLRSGLNILQYATAEIPSQNITVLIHDYDCVPIN